ncbi:MAG: hypothetical protein JXK05_04125 [Campylobacterales bacterium]|nr:hypothetical protein [Campylobacterales bacterium]
MNYGVVNPDHLLDTVTAVCDCLGYGKNHTADLLLLETMAAETGLGLIPDDTEKAGMGICQFDHIGFVDAKKRAQKHFKTVRDCMGLDLELVEWEHLRYSPLLSMLFCRLKYMLIADPIPGDLEGRARYWKRHHNTSRGKGTEKHYIESAELVDRLFD